MTSREDGRYISSDTESKNTQDYHQKTKNLKSKNMKKSKFSQTLFFKRLKTALKLFFKSIGMILLSSFLLTTFLALLWINANSSKPTLENIFLYSTIFSTVGYILFIYIKYNPKRIEKFMLKF